MFTFMTPSFDKIPSFKEDDIILNKISLPNRAEFFRTTKAVSSTQLQGK